MAQGSVWGMTTRSNQFLVKSMAKDYWRTLARYLCIPMWATIFFMVSQAWEKMSEELPGIVIGLVRFMPQLMLAFPWMEKVDKAGFYEEFSYPASLIYGFVLWIVVTYIYGRISMRWRLRVTILAAPFVILIVCALMHAIFRSLGYHLHLYIGLYLY